MQHIDPDIEKPTRDLLGHAIRGELGEMSQQVYAIGDERYLECITLCIAVTAYVAIDVCRMQWPGDADLREIARHAADNSVDYELDAPAVFTFLSRVVFGSDKLDQVFPDLAVSTTLPVLATAQILLSFRPREKHWWEYLDMIEGTTEQAAAIDPAVLPALMFRVHDATARQSRP
jgi:hypothetical protein